MLLPRQKLLAHVWPGWGKGRIRLDWMIPAIYRADPGGASLVYPFIYKSLDLEPVFDEKCLEAEGNFKGRVRSPIFMAVFGESIVTNIPGDDTGF